MVLASFRRQWV